MGATYAGVLGFIALSACLVQGAIHGDAVATTLPRAVFHMFVFAAVGHVIGRLANSMVRESAERRFMTELKLRDESLDSADGGPQ